MRREYFDYMMLEDFLETREFRSQRRQTCEDNSILGLVEILVDAYYESIKIGHDYYVSIIEENDDFVLVEFMRWVFKVKGKISDFDRAIIKSLNRKKAFHVVAKDIKEMLEPQSALR